MSNRPSITSLIPNELFPLLERSRFQSTRRFTNLHAGEHLRGKGGASTEFADYRDYVEGDDMRYIDWNILARLRRPYLKVFHREEDMHVVLLVDASSSMNYGGKLEMAKSLAAAIGTCCMLQHEKVSVYQIGSADRPPAAFKPATGRAGLGTFHRYLEDIEVLGGGSIEQAIDHVNRIHRGKGMILVFSDFLSYEQPDSMLNSLLNHRLEPHGIQILSPEERDPELDRDVCLVDAETGESLDVSGQEELLTLYQEMREGLESRLQQCMRSRGGRFLSIDSSESVTELVSDRFRREGWIT